MGSDHVSKAAQFFLVFRLCTAAGFITSHQRVYQRNYLRSRFDSDQLGLHRFQNVPCSHNKRYFCDTQHPWDMSFTCLHWVSSYVMFACQDKGGVGTAVIVMCQFTAMVLPPKYVSVLPSDYVFACTITSKMIKLVFLNLMVDTAWNMVGKVGYGMNNNHSPRAFDLIFCFLCFRST
eukprot:PhF_6_TR15539/c0_g1_i1/m.24156